MESGIHEGKPGLIMKFDKQHEEYLSVRSCAIYRAIEVLHKPIQRDKSRSYARNGLPVLFVNVHNWAPTGIHQQG
jgi:hypothetical protein